MNRKIPTASQVQPAVRWVTDRLIMEPVNETAQPQEFLSVFNSNPDFIEASELFSGKRAYELSDVEMYLWEETNRENSYCMAIRLRATNELIGTATFMAPHFKEPFPWIGLLLMEGTRQNRGLGAEAAHAIEAHLAKAGWNEVRLAVMQANPRARDFWEREGYVVYGEALDRNNRSVWLMHKSLQASTSGG